MSLVTLSSPDPIGAGTDQCEALSSYVQRIAAFHDSRPGQLVFRILAWIDQGRSREIGRWAAHRGRLLLGNNINAFGQADAWLRALQCATKRSDLIHLTTAAWDRNFPTRGFLANELAWCPCCLQEDRVPYQRLLWTLQSVRVCKIHHLPLQRRCAQCGKGLPVLHDRSVVTGCPLCGGNLLLQANQSTTGAGEFDLWVADEVGKIIARSFEWLKPMEWRPIDAINGLAHSHCIQGAAALGRLIGVSKLTTWYWLTGKARPSLLMALHAFHRCDASLAHALGCNHQNTTTATRCCQPQFHLRRVRVLRQHDWAGVRQYLEAELKADEARPLKAVSQRLSIPSRSLKDHLPELCFALAERCRNSRREARISRDGHLQDQILKAISSISCSGTLLTKRRVELRLGRPGLFNSRYARRLYDAALATAIRATSQN